MIADSSEVHASLFSGQLSSKYALEYAIPNIKGEVYVTNEIEDGEGTWISVLVPMEEVDLRRPVPVFAVDYPVSLWTSRAAARTAQASVVILFGLLILIAF